MKRLAMLVLTCALTLSGCTCGFVDPGNVGVVVNKMGSAQGVALETKDVGFYTVDFMSSVHEFPISEQTYNWTSSAKEGAAVDEHFTFQTAEGLSIDVNMGISYHIPRDKVVQVYQSYRVDLPTLQSTVIHNKVRDALVEVGSGWGVNDENTNTAAAQKGIRNLIHEKPAFLKEVTDAARKQLEPIGISLSSLSLIGDMGLPPNVKNAINAKIEATQLAQKAQNELQTTQAEAAKVKAKAQGEADAITLKAKAEADANLIVAKSITPELVRYESVKKWDGKLSQTVLGSNASTIVDLK